MYIKVKAFLALSNPTANTLLYIFNFLDLVQPVEAEVVPVSVHDGQRLVHEGELLPRRDHLAGINGFIDSKISRSQMTRPWGVPVMSESKGPRTPGNAMDW